MTEATSYYAAVYLRPEAIFVASSAKNTFGIQVMGERFIRLDRAVDAHTLGDAVLVAFAEYRENVPGELYVRGVKRSVHPFLRFTGMRSWKRSRETRSTST